MSEPISVVSSMATKALLGELARAFEARSGCEVSIQSVGGVDAKKRIEDGEVFDVVVLARDAIEKLLAAGHLTGPEVALAHSGVAVAVRAGAPRPAIDTEEALERTVLAARTIGHSTGPSGVQLAEAFARWGVTERLRERIIVAPPGVPVGELVARGEVELGFQQLSELMHVEGIDIVGPLPKAMEIVTTFSAALGARSRQPDPAGAFVAFMASEATSDAKRHHGMDPA